MQESGFIIHNNSKGAVDFIIRSVLFLPGLKVWNMYPKVSVDTKKLLENVRVVRALCGRRHIRITAVTKMFGGDPRLAQVFLDGGIRMLGDARIQNLERMEQLKAEKWLIRIPMLSEAADVVRYADVSLNSELETVRALQKEAKKQNRVHKIILMADMGDIREGYVDDHQLMRTAEEILRMDSLLLYGVGTNLTCFSFVQPDTEKLEHLELLSRAMVAAGGSGIVSGGNSATIDLMLHNGIPRGINNLRLGEALLFGKERTHYQYLDHTCSDVFILQAEIVEIKDKPSQPWGEIGVNSYGKRPVFVDRGVRTRAICAIGRQDVDTGTMEPLDPGVTLLGASSDHLILDVSDSRRSYRIGDIVEFKLGYFAAMRAFNSRYVQKEYH